jgi:hypothetical protein
MFRVLIRMLLGCFLLAPLAATALSATDQSNELLKPQQLDALVAPIALYPDPLLAQVLMASTYPLELVQADRWANENKSLTGDQLKAAVDKQTWDDNVKALVATPSVLTMMSAKLDWTQKLGDAVLAQQPDVMDAIQRLRVKAQANNTLKTTNEQTVTVKQEGSRQVVAIEPTSPDTIYVPQYDPGVVYGEWPYSDYPPYSFWAPGYIAGGVVASGIAFGAGYLVGRWASGGNFWGGGINWGDRNLIANRPTIPIAGVGNRWEHNPTHRQGVRYGNANVQQRFGNNNVRPGGQQGMNFRGRSGQQVLSPGRDRGNVGDRADRGDRVNVGNRGDGGNRAKAADRSAAGERKAGNRAGGERKAANRPSAGNRGAAQRSTSGAARPPQRAAPRRDTGNAQRARTASVSPQRGRANVSGGGARMAGAGGRGGRRSDVALKHDIVLLARLDNGLGFYRFSYIGSDRAYVGVIAQEVKAVMPQAVVRDRDGYLRVFYDKLGVKFETYDAWVASGSRIPSTTKLR